MRVGALAGALVGALLLTGCTVELGAPADTGSFPLCPPVPGTLDGGLVLEAQAVGSAQQLPCLREKAVGWSFADLVVRDGEATFWLNSDRGGQRALSVLLRPSCSLDGATEVPFEPRGIRRFDRVARADEPITLERFYTFAGGCVTLRFDLRSGAGSEPVGTVTDALGFVSRADLAARVREVSSGRLELDRDGAP